MSNLTAKEFKAQAMDKTDKTLGQRVKERFEELGIQTPTVENNLTDQEKLEQLTKLYEEQHRILGLDLEDDSLMDTPKRVAKLQVFESMSGLNWSNFPKMTAVENKFYTGMVSVHDIQAVSLCEHHQERIHNLVSISYIPKIGGKVVGLSKFSRLSSFLADQPTISERYTAQLFEALKLILDTDDVAVTVRSAHMCMYARGVKDPCANTTTTLLGGQFKTDDAMRIEYFNKVDFKKPIISVG